MKRMWIGAGILAALLIAGLLVGEVMDKKVTPGVQKLRRAADAALAEDWEKVRELTEDVCEEWEGLRNLAEALTTHENLEQIEAGFAQLRTYAGADGPACSALCTSLAQQLEALGKAHACSWRNLL